MIEKSLLYRERLKSMFLTTPHSKNDPFFWALRSASALLCNAHSCSCLGLSQRPHLQRRCCFAGSGPLAPKESSEDSLGQMPDSLGCCGITKIGIEVSFASTLGTNPLSLDKLYSPFYPRINHGSL